MFSHRLFPLERIGARPVWESLRLFGSYPRPHVRRTTLLTTLSGKLNKARKNSD